MPEPNPDDWDPAMPTYVVALRDDHDVPVDQAGAIAALVKQGLSPERATAVIAKTLENGSALFQVFDDDWKTMFADLEAAGFRASGWATY